MIPLVLVTRTDHQTVLQWLQPPSPIAFTSSFKIWAVARDGTHTGTTFTVTHAGGDTNFTQFSGGTSTTTVTAGSANLTGP